MGVTFDGTINLGQVITVLTFVGGIIGIWLRQERLLVKLEQRMVHAEARLDGHDYQHRANDQWRLSHVSDHKSA